MPIAYQDLYLLLRAENLGTSAITSFGGMVDALGHGAQMTARHISAIGTGLVTAGTVVTAVGAVGLKFWYDAGKAAAVYQGQVAYTETQAQGLHISLKQLSSIGLDVAKAIGTPLDTIQQGMYNIVSTLKVTAPQLKQLTTDFAKAAVAGQSDISDVSKVTIGELHAYHLPLSDINKLLNLQFEMVKEGRGTYSDFLSVIGNAIPIYAASKNSIQEMGANVAFLTQNSMSAGGAVAAASRALESLTKKDFQKGLAALGISFKDSHGKAKQLDTIVQEIANSPAWAKMVTNAGGNVNKAFTDTFGSGTIQAKRFFDLALTRYPQLAGILQHMNHPGNALGRAYKLMADTTEVQWQKLMNNFHALEITLGNDVLPVFNKLIKLVEKAFQWFDKLSPSTKKFIALGSLFGSLGAVIGGVGLIMSGFFLKFISSLMLITDSDTLGSLVDHFRLLGGSMGENLLKAGPWILAIIAIAAAVYLCIKYHKQIWEWMQKVWHGALTWVDRARASFEHLWKTNELVRIGIMALAGPIMLIIKGIELLIKYHKDLERWAIDTWNGIKQGMEEVKKIAMDVADFFETTWDAFFSWFSTNWDEMYSVIYTTWYLIWNTVKIVWHAIEDVLRPGMQIIRTLFSFGWRVIATTVKASWDIISGIVRDGLKFIMTIIDGAWGVLDDLFHIGWDVISGIVKTAWDIISGVIKAAWSVIEGIFTVALDLITGHWSKAWNDMKHYFGDALHDIENVLTSVMSNIIKLIIQVVPRLWNAMLTIGKTIVNAIWQGINDTWHFIYNFFKGIVKVFKNFFAGLWDAMYGIGKAIVEGLWKGVKDTWHLVKDGVDHLGHGLISGFKDLFHIFSPSGVYYAFGQNMMQGLANGITQNAKLVTNAHNALIKSLPQGFSKFGSGSLAGLTSGSGSQHIQLINIVMPKGMVDITVSSALSQEDTQKLQKAMDTELDKFSDLLVAKVKKVRVA